MKSSLVNYQLEDSIAHVSIDDGKVNVMSIAMLSAINEALDRAGRDRATVVITGRPGVFSAGFDLPVLRAGGSEANRMVRMGFELAERMLSFPTPIVVGCSGHAIAMGVFLVLAADFRIGALGPYRIGANEVAIGITMPHFGIEICRQRLTPAYLNRAVTFSEVFGPEDAVTAGFLDKAVPAAELLPEARKTAATLAQLNMDVYAASKLRVRAPILKAIREAIEKDAKVAQATRAA